MKPNKNRVNLIALPAGPDEDTSTSYRPPFSSTKICALYILYSYHSTLYIQPASVKL